MIGNDDKSGDGLLNSKSNCLHGEECHYLRFLRFEKATYLGILGSFIIFVGVVVWVKLIVFNWWLIWPLALISFRSLQRQRVSLSLVKPYEARIANMFFLLLIISMVARDLVLTILVK